MPSPVLAELFVTIQGETAGMVRQRENGTLTFAYLPAYQGAPLSLSMPLSNQEYGDKIVRPYLFGLVPDNYYLRRTLGREFEVSADNPFALLTHIGRDCPGAVQFFPPDLYTQAFDQAARYEPLTEQTVGHRLQAIANNEQATWQAPEEHWSLGGQQSKIALANFGGQWFTCEGAAATTHIIKPGISALAHQALNEHLCLRLASLCGIPAAQSTFQTFAGVDAIAVRRYDRIIADTYRVIRIHQEDFCQALGILPDHKYTNEGGPSARDIVNLLNGQPNRERNVPLFAAELFFNYLIGAPDAHGKNYSVILTKSNGPLLAPLYDTASGLAYEPPRGGWRLAMGIGGENRMGKLRRSHVQRFAEAAGLNDETALNLYANIAQAILDHLGDIAHEAAELQGGVALSQRLVPEIRHLCEKSLGAL